MTLNWKAHLGPQPFSGDPSAGSHTKGLWVGWTHPGRVLNPLLHSGTWPQLPGLCSLKTCERSAQALDSPFLLWSCPRHFEGSSLLLCQAPLPLPQLSAGGPAGQLVPCLSQHSTVSALSSHTGGPGYGSSAGPFSAAPVFPWAALAHRQPQLPLQIPVPSATVGSTPLGVLAAPLALHRTSVQPVFSSGEHSEQVAFMLENSEGPRAYTAEHPSPA